MYKKYESFLPPRIRNQALEQLGSPLIREDITPTSSPVLEDLLASIPSKSQPKKPDISRLGYDDALPHISDSPSASPSTSPSSPSPSSRTHIPHKSHASLKFLEEIQKTTTELQKKKSPPESKPTILPQLDPNAPTAPRRRRAPKKD